tara:strand:- start:6 stop:281 length:276 start_codon:yes stop_codon:yes gene_type:complete
MSKNECGKTRKTDDPYEVWTGANGFEWRVLKKYQKPELEAKNPYARWFCAVKSNFTYGSFELGDVYVSEIKANGEQVPTEVIDFVRDQKVI